MSKIDQFESAFKSAAKTVYQHAPIGITKVLLITDLGAEPTVALRRDVQHFLALEAEATEAVAWCEHAMQPGETAADLLELVEQQRPDLLCCYRNLYGRARRFPFSLGSHVDVLCQATDTPLLLLPTPDENGRLPTPITATKTVLVLTDHLTGSDRLIHFGTRFVRDDGALVLAHLEDDAIFERYIDTIAKIPAIDSEFAREKIQQQLLKEPHDYIASVVQALRMAEPELCILEEVRMGHRVADCQALLTSHQADLLVMNTKDDEQLAMHGLAYPLAIELRDCPQLLL